MDRIDRTLPIVATIFARLLVIGLVLLLFLGVFFINQARAEDTHDVWPPEAVAVRKGQLLCFTMGALREALEASPDRLLDLIRERDCIAANGSQLVQVVEHRAGGDIYAVLVGPELGTTVMWLHRVALGR